MTAANTRPRNFPQHAPSSTTSPLPINHAWLVCTARLLGAFSLPPWPPAWPSGLPELSAPVHPSNLPLRHPHGDAAQCNEKSRPKPTTPPRASATPPQARPQASRQGRRATSCAQAGPPPQPTLAPAAIALARAAKRITRQARTAWRQEQTARRNLVPWAAPATLSPSPLVGLGREERTKGRGEGSPRTVPPHGLPPCRRRLPPTRPPPCRRRSPPGTA